MEGRAKPLDPLPAPSRRRYPRDRARARTCALTPIKTMRRRKRTHPPSAHARPACGRLALVRVCKSRRVQVTACASHGKPRLVEGAVGAAGPGGVGVRLNVGGGGRGCLLCRLNTSGCYKITDSGTRYLIQARTRTLTRIRHSACRHTRARRARRWPASRTLFKERARRVVRGRRGSVLPV